MLKTIKRDCSLDDFKEEKISNAILMAMKNGSGIIEPDIAKKLQTRLRKKIKIKKK